MNSRSYYPRNNETVERLMSIGFSFDEANDLMDWWVSAPDGMEWLMTASEEEIRNASEDALA